MKTKIKIIKSKLMTPRSGQTLRRNRLESLLSDISQKKLTKITAGAGFGKTTLISQYAAHSDSDTVWYRIDRMENDYILFINYLIYGIKQYCSYFGNETLQRIKVADNPEAEYSDVFTFFVSEIEKIENKKITIVLDDFHHVHENKKIQILIEFILENLPDNFHIVVLSRNEPSISVTKLITAGEVTEIGEKDLSFTFDEVKRLYKEKFNLEIKDKKLQELHLKTDGWAAGLLLLYHSIKGNNNVDVNGVLDKLKGAPKVFFNFFDENVYKDLSDKKKEFLNKTSILTSLNVDACNNLLEIQDSGQILAELEKDHLFTISVEDEKQSYFYHHLFRDYLNYKLALENNREVIIDLNIKAARFLEQNQELEEALEHYLRAGRYKNIIRILSDLAQKRLIVARVNMFQRIIDKIPLELKKNEPWILYSQALLNMFAGRIDEAKNNFNSALVLFEKMNIESGINNCESYLANLDFQAGNLIDAEKKYQKILIRDSLEPELRIDILGFVFYINTHLGNFNDIDRYFEDAQKLISSLNNNLAKDLFKTLFLIHKSSGMHLQGKFKEAYRFSKKAKYAISKVFTAKALSLLLSSVFLDML